jgi:hypothetical protein
MSRIDWSKVIEKDMNRLFPKTRGLPDQGALRYRLQSFIRDESGNVFSVRSISLRDEGFKSIDRCNREALLKCAEKLVKNYIVKSYSSEAKQFTVLLSENEWIVREKAASGTSQRTPYGVRILEAKDD